MTRLLGLAMAFLLLVGVLAAQNPIDDEVVNDTVQKLFADDLAAKKETYGGSEEHLVRMGLVADRQKRRIEILAVNTGLGEDAPTEFFLVGANGKEYESLAVTLAKGSDVHEALAFIGVEPGRPTNFQAFQFWPKGERINVFFAFEKQGQTHRIRAEDMILDQRTGKTLPKTGFMFVGSIVKEFEGKEVYLADNVGDMISDFNSPWTVLDVPYRAEQGTLYGSLVPNPKHLLKMRHTLKVVLEPQLPVDQAGVLDLLIAVSPKDKESKLASDLQFTVQRGEHIDLEQGAFKAFLDLLMKQTKAKKDIYATFVFGGDCQVGALAELAKLINQLVERKVIRIEAHPRHLYYEAFLPNKQWLDPKQRLMQPLELHLNAAPGGHVMRYFEEEFMDNGDTRLIEKKYLFSGSAELMKLIASRERWDSGTVLFYVPSGAEYRLLRKFYLEQREKFPIAYVFEETATFGK